MANNFRNGQVRIANEILDQLAIRASEEINGVHTPQANDNKLNISQNGPKSTVSQVDGKLHVNLIKTVKDIQENVVRVIESMTGLRVSRVNVDVPKLVF